MGIVLFNVEMYLKFDNSDQYNNKIIEFKVQFFDIVSLDNKQYN